MKRLSFLISLTNDDNDYQQEQAAAAEKTARRLGVEVKIIHASNDPLVQSQQLLQYVQDSSKAKPDAIMFARRRDRVSPGGQSGGRSGHWLGGAEF